MDSSERRKMILARLRKEGAREETKKKKRATDTKEGFIARYGEEAWNRKRELNKKWREAHKEELSEYQRRWRERKKATKGRHEKFIIE